MRRREFTAENKAKIIMEVIAGDSSTAQIASREGINPKQLQNWKKEFCDNAAKAFGGSKAEKEAAQKVREMQEKERIYQAKVGQLTLEADFLKGCHEKVHGVGWKEKIGYKD